MTHLQKNFLLLAFLLYSLSLNAQWEKLPPPGLDNIEQIFRSGDLLYARGERDIYRSPDLGGSWESVLNEYQINSLAVWGDTIFAVVANNDIRASYDHGASWQNIPPPAGMTICNIRVLGDHLIGLCGAGIVARRNLAAGTDWEPMAQISGLSIANGLWWGSKYGQNGVDTIYSSADFGVTWIPATTCQRLRDFSVHGNSIVASDYSYPHPNLMRITGDLSQASWDTLLTFTSTGVGSIDLLHTDNPCLMQLSNAYGTNIILRSEDGFVTWDTLNIPINSIQNFGYLDIVRAGSKWLVPGGKFGVAISDDGGQKWYYGETGLGTPVTVPFFGIMPTVGDWLSVDMENTATMFSATAGKSWFRPIVGRSRPFQPAVYSQGYYFNWSLDNKYSPVFNCDSLYRSPDGFSNWELIKPSGFTYCGGRLFGDKKYLYAYTQETTYQALARSADAGETWEFLNPPAVTYGQMDTLNGKLVLYNDKQMWVSDDDGETFTLTGTYDVWVNGRQVVLADGAVYILDKASKIQRSLDFGKTWKPYSQNLVDDTGALLGIVSLDHRGGRTVVIATKNTGPYNPQIWFTDNQGATWKPGVTFFPHIPNQVNKVRLTDNYLFVFGNECYRLPLNRLENFANIGTIFYDINANGTLDASDKLLRDIGIQALPYGQQARSEPTGTYTLYANLLADTIRPVLAFPYAKAVPPFRIATSPAANQDFAIQLTPGIKDLRLDLTPSAPFRPGFETAVSLSCRNVGSVALTPAVGLKLPPDCSYVWATPDPDVVAGDSLAWHLPVLGPFENFPIELSLRTDVSATLGSPLVLTARALPVAGDQTPLDNVIAFQDTIIGAYDPNDKLVLPGNYTTVNLATGDPLQYTIRFQNTGTYPAVVVRIEDSLSARLDRTSFRLEQSSHPVRYELQDDGVVVFDFPGIILPSIGEDEAGSQGFVRYSIRPLPDLQIGENVPNTAYIYFDYNTPVVTNTTQSILQEIVSVWGKYAPGAIRLFPNPAKEMLHWELPEHSGERIKGGFISDVSGRKILDLTKAQGNAPIQIGYLPPGQYILCLHTERGWYVGKWSKN